MYAWWTYHEISESSDIEEVEKNQAYGVTCTTTDKKNPAYGATSRAKDEKNPAYGVIFRTKE